jgi:hypothetical protein
MRQEAVLEEALYEDNKFVDAGMFSLLATEYPDYAVVFVAFPRGVLAVRGSSTAVEGIRFYGYGQRIEDPYERRVAIRTGVSDDDRYASAAGRRCLSPYKICSFPRN